jgi:hypothetical protein
MAHDEAEGANGYRHSDREPASLSARRPRHNAHQASTMANGYRHSDREPWKKKERERRGLTGDRNNSSGGAGQTARTAAT